MKILMKVLSISAATLVFSACTFGDKGSERVPDSVSIDTNQTSSPEGGYTGTGVTTDTPVNTGRGTIMKDTTVRDSITGSTKKQ